MVASVKTSVLEIPYRESLLSDFAITVYQSLRDLFLLKLNQNNVKNWIVKLLKKNHDPRYSLFCMRFVPLVDGTRRILTPQKALNLVFVGRGLVPFVFPELALSLNPETN